jgi:hypothetical protein
MHEVTILKTLTCIPAFASWWLFNIIPLWPREFNIPYLLMQGLMTPIVRNADQKSISAISSEVTNVILFLFRHGGIH